MESSWETHYSLEASNYLLDNGQLAAALFFALEALNDSPAPDEFRAEDGLQMAVLEGHQVAFTRDFEHHIVTIRFIRPSMGAS
ncbi:MAG: hypothetical protein R3A44_45225 [Caldilineaceae bacterium]